MKKLILASASPRRKDLLKTLGLEFDIIPSNVEENIEGIPFSNALIEELALSKAQDVASKADNSSVVIGADTVVVVDSVILGKPKDEQDAAKMLKMLSGRTHSVVSGIAVVDKSSGKILTDSVESLVTFRDLDDEEINNYIKTGEPLDKAGAYAIQGYASIFVSFIKGDCNNIIGLSTYKLAEMLKEVDIKVL